MWRDCGVLICACVLAACTKHNPRACANGLCTDPAYPFCDVDGTLAGMADTCIAVECTPMEFVACRGADKSLTCNATGDNYDINQCEGACDPTNGCTAARTPYIVFTSNRDGNNEIYRMNVDGTMPTNLTSDPSNDNSAQWDPTGDHIAFLSNRTGTQELYVMNADGTGARNVSAGQAQEPAWSMDGTQLAFTSNRTGHLEIFKALIAGGSPIQLTTYGVDNTGKATWSSDGMKIAFESSSRIYVMASDGTGATAITAGPGSGALRGEHVPRWSPVGTKIAFARGLTFENWDMFLMNPDGQQPIDMTFATSTTSVEGFVVWSPTGDFLVGTTAEGNSSSPMYGTGVYVVAASGAGFDNIVLPPADLPCWSADGTTVTYESSRSGNLEIYAVPRTGGAPINLTNSGGDDTQCSARPR